MNVRLLLSFFKGVIGQVLLVRWPVADFHYKVLYPCPPFNPGPLRQLLIQLPVELHALQMVTDIEGKTASLPRMPILPKEPVPSIPTLQSKESSRYGRVISKVIALQVGTRLWFILFIPHVVCISIEAFKLGPQ